MPVATVKLRSDLLLSRHGQEGNSFFVIKDPASERFFRFGETEHFIAQQLDGATAPESVRQRVQERFGALSPETLQQFIERLRRLGLVTDGETAPEPARKPRRRIAGDMFYLRCKLFDPDWLFDRLAPALRFLFTPLFLALSASLILCALAVTVGRWEEMSRDLRGLLRFESLALAWGICLVVILMHEFAHGLTCKHFGGRVREIGFMLIYFQPAFYCNVSDAWLFPKKSHRLWVTFAGGYFELFLWALATLFWRVTEPASTLNYLALVVAATSGIKIFFNMNPLIKLDGYYLLSDWLDVPNLRRKAFACLRSRFKSLLTLRCPAPDGTTARERRIFIIFGLLAAAYSFWLLSIVFSHIGSFLVERYQAWGFVLFGVLLTGVFRNPIRRCAGAVSSELSLAQEKQRRTLKRLVKILGALAVVATALYVGRLELKVAGDFTVLPIHNADVRAEVDGIIQEIYHNEGDIVNRGEVIARLADRDCAAELRKVKAEIEEKEAKLKMLRTGARPEEVELARTTVAKTEQRTRFASQQWERDKALFDQQLLSRRDFDVAQEQLALREKESQEAKDQLKVLLAGSRAEDIEALEAEVRRLAAHERFLEEKRRLHTVGSPAAGVVTTRRLKEKIGQYVEKGDLIAEVHELKTITAEIAVPEKEIADVRVGQKVVLKARAHPALSFQGAVSAIAPVATTTNNWRNERTVLVTTELDNTSLVLKPEMTGRAKIYCGERRPVDLFFRRIVRYLRVEFWSWW